ncbi:AAA family ATPase [Haloarcula sp. H-GB4]|jgi:DNA sulfur modification protein DndD|uniref:AAA family ATPase n=1 Tax=Haloarcula sp. H-GB4 TaxID=3069755 RepID=UPI0027B1A39D|nr:AAA family ATPase [Haloarcula sp. H-GB4]MDQ2074840.1 AAA family ATPase [Haloarcula sp. H-GB4]
MNNIQIFELILKDYRQYKDKTEIPLEVTSEKNINVIEGQNGAGKSNILNAITLCFYREEAHTDSRGGAELETDPYISKRKLESLDPGESAEGYVEIRLGKDKPKYAFRRTFTTVKQSSVGPDGEPEYTNSLGELTLRQRFGGNDWEPIAEPENILHEILPTRVHQYFLFDGEQLDEFFEEGYADRVKEAVLDVSHVELLNEADDHLEEVKRDYEKETSSSGEDVANLEDRKEKAEQELERLESERKTLKEDIGEAKSKIQSINDSLSGSGDDDVREKQQRREYLEGKVEEKEDQLTQNRANVGSSLAQAGAVSFNSDAISYAIEAIEEYEASDDGLQGVSEELIEGLLSQERCICGADLTEGTDAHAEITSIEDEIRSNGHSEISGKLRIQRALSQGESYVNELLEDKKELNETQDWIDEKESELFRIASQLEDIDTIDNEKAVELEKQRQRISERIDEMNQELGELNGKIESQEQVIDDRREEWREAAKQKKENQKLVEKSLFISDASDEINDIKEDILGQVRSQTEERLEQYYNDLIWKDDDYEIVLTDKYEVKLYDADGRKNLGSLAAGERQVLALSFMTALSKISGFSAPIIIDTPLGRISSEPKKLIAQNVPDYLEDTQVTFLMTDVEYSEDVRAFIADEVANEYHLDYQAGVTEVVER